MTQRRDLAINDKMNTKKTHTREILDMEKEAELLEKREADLLRQLTVTQDRENLIYDELKHALIESSLCHKIRPEKIKLDEL